MSSSISARISAAFIAIGAAAAFAIAGASAANAVQPAEAPSPAGTFSGPGSSLTGQSTALGSIVLHADGYGIGG